MAMAMLERRAIAIAARFPRPPSQTLAHPPSTHRGATASSLAWTRHPPRRCGCTTRVGGVVARSVLSQSHPPFLTRSSSSADRTRRTFWSSVIPGEGGDGEDEPPPHPLPLPPMMPHSSSATALIAPSDVELLKSLTECRSALDTANGGLIDGGEGETGTIEPAKVREAHSNLNRARDILLTMPRLQLSTYLLGSDLHSLCGEYDQALGALARYEHLGGDMGRNERTMLQFLRAGLQVRAGRFSHALSEYEDLLEEMEKEVERQMKQIREDDSEGVEERLPVLHGASALTGVGATKLLMHAREGGEAGLSAGEILDPLETAVNILLESRRDALNSPDHTALAVDLGLAAAISLANLGVAHSLLSNDARKSIECWRRGLETIDGVLRGAVAFQSVTIIPRHRHQCMESVRARLHCSISIALLGEGNENGATGQASDETLKEASEDAKRALDVYDQLMHGPKAARDIEGGTKFSEEEQRQREEWEQILAEGDTEDADDCGTDARRERPSLSPLWAAGHRAESARALSLVARCYALAGAAVTAEGLFQAALDASSSYSPGQNLKRARGGMVGRGVSLSSPGLGLIARDGRLWYASLCDGWEKRKGDADRLRADARRIEEEGVLKAYVMGKDHEKRSVSGLEASIWLFNPLDFER